MTDLVNRQIQYNLWCEERKYPEDARLQLRRGVLPGTFKLGGAYSNISGYPGAWPVQVIKRLHILFPEIAEYGADHLLHLFAGSLALGAGNGHWIQRHFDMLGATLDACTTKGWEKDLRPDIHANAESFTEELAWQAYLARRGADSDAVFKMILGDPPFNGRQADAKYNCALPNRSKVLEQCHRALVDGGILIWQDEMEPLHAHSRWQHILDVVLDLGQGKYLRKLTGLRKISDAECAA